MTNGQQDEREIEFMRFMDDADGESDKGFLLSASAYLELIIERCVRAYLLMSPASKRLLRRDGPFGTHSARVDLCFCVGIVDEHESETLRILANLRNKFAHQFMADLTSKEAFNEVLDFAKLVGLEELDRADAMKLRQKGTRSLLNVATLILADNLRERDLLVDSMAKNLRFDFSQMHRDVQRRLEEIQDKKK